MDKFDLVLNGVEYNKVNSLNSLNMFHGQLYETIITTLSTEFKKNAAPIGVVCKDSNHIVIYLNQSSTTSKNIVETGEFIVNITHDPLLFTYSTIGNLNYEYFIEFNEFPLLKNNLGFFKAHVIKDKVVTKKDDISKRDVHIITAKVDYIYLTKPTGIQPINRAMGSIIESLVHYSRFESLSKDKRNEYWIRILELNRVTQKVGNSDDKKSMNTILAKIEENFGLKK